MEFLNDNENPLVAEIELLGKTIDLHKNFFEAVIQGDGDYIKWLFQVQKPDLNYRDVNGSCAIHMLTKLSKPGKSHVKMLELLLAQPELHVNERESDGSTALINAAALGHLQMVQMLLRHPRIQIGHTNDCGYSAYFLANNHGHHGVRALLDQKYLMQVPSRRKRSGFGL